MLAGDLVAVCGQVSSATTGNITVANTGGQTWNGPYEQAGNDQDLCIYWCQFDGTWDANPTFTCAALSGTQPYSVIMHVWRPPTPGHTWGLDQAFVGANLAAATTATITGQTTGADNTVTLATWCTNDDNTWTNLAGTGWASIGPTQQRNLAGADQSMTWANFISATSGTATGNVSKDMGGVGTDAGVTGIVTWKAVAPRIWNRLTYVNQAIQRASSY